MPVLRKACGRQTDGQILQNVCSFAGEMYSRICVESAEDDFGLSLM